jgi:beta-glucosidase
MAFPIFPKDFIFGTATSAFQVEGSPYADGKGPSIWDTFSQIPGKIFSGETADIACDTYRHPLPDLDLMVALRLSAYRFSVSWARILPQGRGQVNQKGLDYYSHLVDALIERNIQPFVTLFHWDLPQALQDLCAGFASRDCAGYFADYAEIVVKALGDRVGHWITINEPWEFAGLGHFLGTHAPGVKNPWTYLRVAHHQLLGHGLAVERIRSVSPGARIGITLSISPVFPETDHHKDQRAALLANQALNDFYLDAIFKGVYPQPLWNRFRLIHPRVLPGDMEIISKPIDFLGVNYYSREFAHAAWYVPFVGSWIKEVNTRGKEMAVNGREYTANGREIYPPAFYQTLMSLKNNYGNPLVYITENGAAFYDHLEDGCVHDPRRIAFLEGYMQEAARAIQDGANIQGYFIWSLLDNFEWNLGTSIRFGLVYVDFATQQRIIKDSGYWLRELICNQ